MGPSLQKEQQAGLEGRGKLRLSIKLSPQELQSLEGIVKKRSQFKFPYICTVERLIKEKDSTSVFCQSFNHVTIQYETFDYLLSQGFRNVSMPQMQIQKIIFSVCSALTFFRQQKFSHGDIQPKLICYNRGQWKLLDNYFIKGGISAYQKILEGQEAFISPAQMEKIRHGFVRESPAIEESDEVFGLGMTCLELMTAKPSSLCYKQSYIRFNEKNMSQAILLAQSRFPQYFTNLVLGMINMNEQKRVSIKYIISQPFISRHSKKLSLRGSVQV